MSKLNINLLKLQFADYNEKGIELQCSVVALEKVLLLLNP